MRKPEDDALTSFLGDPSQVSLSYDEAKRRYVELGDAIRSRYEQEYTAVSVDVVQSRALKDSGSELETQLTFDAYHRWAEAVLGEHACRQSEWAGDGLIALFQQPDAAVWFGKALLEGLGRFNSGLNRLQQPVQIRIGVNTGKVLPGDDSGVGRLASRTLDAAGHLQKHALPNQMLISERTYALLRGMADQFAPVRRDAASLGLCYAYPASSALLEPRGETVPAPAPGGAVPLGWIVGGIAGAAVLGVGVAALLLANRPEGPGSISAAGFPTVTIRQEMSPPAVVTPGGPNNPLSNPTPAVPRVPRGRGVPAAPAQGIAPPAGTPPAAMRWSPALVPWRSPAATSGLPTRLVESPPELRWAVCIGVGQYADSGFAAPGAGGDARAVAALFQRHAAVPPSHIRLLTDGEATLQNIKLAFQWLQRNAVSGRDMLFIYLAGHGLLAPDRPDFRHPAGSGYAFAPADARASDLPNSVVYGLEISAWLAATRSQMIVVLADTAHAGALDVPGLADPGRQLAVFAATGENGRLGPRGPQGSALASALAEGLRGAADLTRDRRVGMEELRRFLEADLPRRTGGQQVPAARTGFGGYLPELQLAAGG